MNSLQVAFFNITTSSDNNISNDSNDSFTLSTAKVTYYETLPPTIRAIELFNDSYSIAFMSFLSIISSVISTIIFSMPTFKGSLYQYLLIQSINDVYNSITSFMIMVGNLGVWKISYGRDYQIYGLIINRFVAEGEGLFIIILSAIISWDRYTLIKQNYRKILMNYKPWVVSLSFLLLSLILFIYQIPNFRFFCWLNCNHENGDFIYYGIEPGSLSYYTNIYFKIWNGIALTIRAIIAPVIHTIINVLLYKATKEHLAKKKKLTSVVHSVGPTTDSSIKTNEVSLSATNINNQVNKNEESSVGFSTNNTVTIKIKPVKPKKVLEKNTSSDNVETKVLYMVVTMTTVILIGKLFDLMGLLVGFFTKYSDGIKNLFDSFTLLSGPLIFASRIFIYYYFNSHYKKAFHDLFTCRLFFKK